MLNKLYFYIVSVFFRIFCRIKVTGAENIPEGSAIICSNHTSMLDPLVLAIAMFRKRRFMTRFMAKAELSRIPVLSFLIKPLVVFVDRGKSDRAAIIDTINLLRNGKRIIIFPEGTRVNPNELSRAQTGVALMAVKSGAPIVPAYLTAGKKNLLRFPKLRVVFGEAYHAEKEEGLSTSRAYRKIADDLMERIFSLKDD